MKTKAALAILMLSSAALPSVALADTAPTAAVTLPAQLGPNARERYRDIFATIDAGKWADASAKLAAMDEGPLHPTARAIIYTAKGSPKVEAADLVNWQPPRLICLILNRLSVWLVHAARQQCRSSPKCVN